MATVNGLTAERMLAIEAGSVVDGDVIGDNLILTKHDGSTLNAGSVRGPQGAPGTNGTNGLNANAGNPWSNTVTYAPNDTVGYDGRWWKCIATNTDKCPPFNLGSWTAMMGKDNDNWVQGDPYFQGDSFAAWELFWVVGTSTASLTSTAGEFETGIQAAKFVMGVNSTQRIYDRGENVLKGAEAITITVRAKLVTAVAGVTIAGSLFQAPPNGLPQPFGTGANELGATQGPLPLTTTWQTFTFTMSATNARPRSRANVILQTPAGLGATVVIDYIKVSKTAAIARVNSQINLAQRLLTGGGIRKISTTGISWSQRFIIVGLGRNNSAGPSGYFEITMPPDGTVIPVYGGSATSVTVAAGSIPMASWYQLFYDLPLGGTFTSDPSRFRIVDFSVDFKTEIPPTWLLVCARNQDTRSCMYMWGDGRNQDPWKTLTLQNSWVAYGSSWNVPAWRFRDSGELVLRGLMKSGTAPATFTTLATDLVPDGAASTGFLLSAPAAGGVARMDVHGDGTLVILGYTAPATNVFISLDNISWFPAGT